MSRGIDLARLLSPSCSADEARAIMDRDAAEREALRKHRQNIEQHRERMVKKRISQLRRAAVSDIRTCVYVPPTGLLAWSLMGRRIFR